MGSQTAVGTGYKDNRVFHVSAPKLINCNSDSAGDNKDTAVRLSEREGLEEGVGQTND
jgi:hypothetical protein